MGLGHHGGGVAAVRYLVSRGACVTVSDSADQETLADSLGELANLNLDAVHLGPHQSTDFHAEFVVVNPAVRPQNSFLHAARDAGARLISEVELFLEACPAQVIGVTGTNGKTTTCTMLHAMLAAGGRRAWLGGNIGRSLLGDLDSMTADDMAVLELSSFQLAHLGNTLRMPELAVITNCSPNHLDWHGHCADYRASKQKLVSASAAVVFNDHDSEVARWGELAHGRVVPSWPLERVPSLSVPGEHNRENAACAAAAAELAGIAPWDICRSLERFRGLPHRLEPLGTVAGRRFFNDSKSTSPAAALAALATVDGPLWLLAGGDAKGADLGVLGAAIAARVEGAALFGAARGPLHAAIGNASPNCKMLLAEQLATAFDWCCGQSRVGDAIVLSPGCASHDQFLDYQHRGEAFRRLLDQLAACRTA
jgi:UDP-N-acetylmuramoylalanine--D-glutamate ligase